MASFDFLGCHGRDYQEECIEVLKRTVAVAVVPEVLWYCQFALGTENTIAKFFGVDESKSNTEVLFFVFNLFSKTICLSNTSVFPFRSIMYSDSGSQWQVLCQRFRSVVT